MEQNDTRSRTDRTVTRCELAEILDDLARGLDAPFAGVNPIPLTIANLNQIAADLRGTLWVRG
jgi:ABC-type lipopolysaccharide export system ATPase subunit